MKIDRKKAKKAFQNYVKDYNIQDEKVRLKVEHTYRVSDLSEAVAESLRLPQEEVDLSWLIGLLHDIGRFEQLKKYGTFIDAQSIDHAAYGANLLFVEGEMKIRDYVEDDSEDELIKTAITCHNAYRIPENLDKRTERFCHILRDADKIDILKVNVDYPLEEIYNVTREELRSGQVTEVVLESFVQGKTVLRSLKRSAVDHVVGHISLVYEFVYPKSLSLAIEQGYLEKIMDFSSDNPVTEKQFEKIRGKMYEYISHRQSNSP